MYALTLSNNKTWFLSAGDEDAGPVVAQVAAAMGLLPIRSAALDSGRLVEVYLEPPQHPGLGIPCILPPAKTQEETAFVRFFHTGLALARLMQAEGVLLLHAALAVHSPAGEPPRGVLFSAPGGTGKSTTSRRLPAPWRSLSDDASLVVPVGGGHYRAHPWPTWSRYLYEETPDACWPVQESVPLSACIFLKQAPEDTLEQVGAGQTASLLAESGRQINFWDHDIPDAERSAFRLRRFDSVCELAKSVPAFLLNLSLDGQFWLEIEKVLA